MGIGRGRNVRLFILGNIWQVTQMIKAVLFLRGIYFDFEKLATETFLTFK